jgi:mannose-6-phosphate isomerase-like protein (cupin superfamily)
MKRQPMKNRAVYRHGPEDDQPIAFIGDLFTIKARSSDTNGAYSVTDMRVSPRANGPPLHHHEDCEESFYVVSGKLLFQIDGVEIPAPAGTFVVVPRGAEHSYTNPWNKPSRVVVLISPPGFERQFVEMGEYVGDA